MRGSIAIWHDTLADGAKGYAPRAEIHINIWKGDNRNTNRRFHLFDIGIRFKEVRSLGTLSICLPFEVEPKQVSDLFDVMHHNSTLSAIFNETLSAGELQNNGKTFKALDERKKVQFHVSRCSEVDRKLTTIGTGQDAGSVIMLNDEFFDRMRERIGDQYLRMRVSVPFGARNGFVSEVDPDDKAFLSTISTNEIVEFRLNERRNFSNAILDKLSGSADLIEISAVHYFLIRDMNVEMTQSHTNFKKMRRLEPEIWTRYLREEPQIVPENMIIYHWSSTAQPEGTVESFSALATFRAYITGRLRNYAMVVVALGAAGSALQSLFQAPLTALADRYGPQEQWSIAIANFVIITVICAVLVYVVEQNRTRSSSAFGRVIESMSKRR